MPKISSYPDDTPADTDKFVTAGGGTNDGPLWSTIKTALTAIFAPIAKGVTNGDSHNHVGGDGAQIDHGGLAGLSDDDHTQYVQTTGNETIAGVKTFSSFPVTPSAAPTTDYQAANKKYVDDSVSTSWVLAWIDFNGTGTPSITDDLNFSSITDNGVGYYDLNFTSSTTDNDYACAGMAVYSNVWVSYGESAHATTKTTAKVVIQVKDSNNSAFDSSCVTIIVIGNP